MTGPLSPGDVPGWVLGDAGVPCPGAGAPGAEPGQGSRDIPSFPESARARSCLAGWEHSPSAAPHPAQPLIQPPRLALT